jgi:hypothetical protein
MLSITECKKKLNRKVVHLNDREIEIIRNVLYNLANECHNIINNNKNIKQ